MRERPMVHTNRIGVDAGSEKRLGQGDVAQLRMQVEGRGGRVAADDGVHNSVLEDMATVCMELEPVFRSQGCYLQWKT